MKNENNLQFLGNFGWILILIYDHFVLFSCPVFSLYFFFCCIGVRHRFYVFHLNFIYNYVKVYGIWCLYLIKILSISRLFITELVIFIIRNISFVKLKQTLFRQKIVSRCGTLISPQQDAHKKFYIPYWRYRNIKSNWIHSLVDVGKNYDRNPKCPLKKNT